MESIRNEIQQHFLAAKKLILDAKYYKAHREEALDGVTRNAAEACIYLAEENLKEAGRLVEKLR